MKKPNNYARFYALLKQVAGADAEAAKEALVAEHTGGRTSSLREMNQREYDVMCDTMQSEVNHPGISEDEYKATIKPIRSAVLHRMQKLGIDTTDFNAVDSFLLNSRIASKRFAQLTAKELQDLIPKFESMLRKKPRSTATAKPKEQGICEIAIPLIICTNQLPS